MTEVPVVFGPNESLFGVVSQPESTIAPHVALLLFNAGVLPRQGPHRLNVRIAQTLAKAGITTLRFDLAGQGDSRPPGRAVDFRQQAVADLQSAMDHLQQAFGIDRFLIFGVCSGAMNAYDVAQVDPRVAGLLMFDGAWYRSRWTMLIRDWKRLRTGDMSRAATAALRRVRGLFRSRLPSSSAPAKIDEGGDYGNPPKAQFVAALNAMVARGQDVFLIYSGTVIEFYSYHRQFAHVFSAESFFGRVRCEYCPDLDHTFVTRQAQQRMVSILEGWVRSHIARG